MDVRKAYRPFLLSVLFSLFVVGCGGGGGGKPVALNSQQITAKASPGVVYISGTSQGNKYSGSGVVLDVPRRLVLTNDHVVTGLNKLRARLQSQAVSVKVLAHAACDDLALVELTEPLAGMKALPLGKSATLKVGQPVTALGYPESLQHEQRQNASPATGVVQANNLSTAPDPSLPRYPSLVQHSAPTNPGNSGGPLLNSYGQVVGIDTLGNEALQNQNYAVSIDHVKSLLPDLEAGKSSDYVGWNLERADQVDFSNLYSLSRGDDAYTHAQLRRHGLNKSMYVIGVDSDSPADRKRIAEGDLIWRLNGDNVKSATDVCDTLKTISSGSRLKVDGTYLFSGTPSQTFKDWGEKVNVK